MQNFNITVKPKTPVYRNTYTGEVVCGDTLEEALGVKEVAGLLINWCRAGAVPIMNRIAAKHPNFHPDKSSSFQRAIVRNAYREGVIKVKVNSVEHKVEIIHVDRTKVLYKVL